MAAVVFLAFTFVFMIGYCVLCHLPAALRSCSSHIHVFVCLELRWLRSVQEETFLRLVDNVIVQPSRKLQLEP